MWQIAGLIVLGAAAAAGAASGSSPLPLDPNPVSTTDREKWNERYRTQQELSAPSPFLDSLDGVLPRAGRALDVAGGSGRNSLWLARRGFDVTLADVSDFALERARQAALAEGLSIATLDLDLESSPLPAGPWDLILCMYFLHRPLFATFAEKLAPGGWLVLAHATRTNLTRNPRPGLDHLLEDGELPVLVRGLEVVRSEEGWMDSGRHEARMAAQKPLG
jgi:tellurite methyltransferase